MTKCRCGQHNLEDDYEVATDAEGFTSCCGAQSTYMDGDLCCKCCYHEVTGGVADMPVTYRLPKGI